MVAGSKSVIGDNTDTEVVYTYDPTSKMLTTVHGYDYLFDGNYSHNYSYDNEYRIEEITENINTDGEFYNYKKTLTYDTLGRLFSTTYTTHLIGESSTGSTVSFESIYNDSGILYMLVDAETQDIISRLEEENARGQATEISLGNNLAKNRQYDAFGFVQSMTDIHYSNGSKVFDMHYNFDSQRGLLNNRTNNQFGGAGGWNETFTYDNQNRLRIISGDVNFVQHYDERGRITTNSNVGSYSYTGNNYQANKVSLNTTGKSYYQNHELQQITYNAYKKPVEIIEEGYGRVSFDYNPISMSRATSYYGSEAENKNDRPFIKHYSNIIPVEITEDTVNGAVKIVTFVGGDAYSAPIVHIKETGANAKDDFYYLHRDYLGSILAITDSNANIVEQRQFGACGGQSVKKMSSGHF